ncbi:cytochrome bd-type quinol oxidase subunit 2 [Nocardioides daedukensis]|uniref:Cytochrome bd-type quinol oxidase subunit 2 n=1 Tax=Nocardioides daedukensis TaxID=634462 RepID=A0A7Y9S3I9_9ACTN|nr:cytochrome bd-type quinol oxidase subunit 2 [Nocardioides daedukensis]
MSTARRSGTRSTGRQVLVAVYAVFAVAAGARSAVQIATKFDEAPAAYLLSAFAALVYVVATIALRYQGSRAFAVALTAISVEMVGVLGVGALSLADPDLFPDQTVWSDFGSGYGFVPLLLPIIGLVWLWRQGSRTSPQPAS